MSVFCTVRFDWAPDDLTAFEEAHPEIFEQLMGPGMKYIIGHRRFLHETHVLDIDEYRSLEDYQAFAAAAASGIAIYGSGGPPPVDTVYTEAADSFTPEVDVSGGS